MNLKKYIDVHIVLYRAALVSQINVETQLVITFPLQPLLISGHFIISMIFVFSRFIPCLDFSDFFNLGTHYYIPNIS